MAALAFELRTAHVLASNLAAPPFGQVLEEVLEGSAEVDNSVLNRSLGDFQHPRELRAFDRIELAAQGQLRRLGQASIFAMRSILPLPFVQGVVPRKARGSTSAAKIIFLHGIRAKRYFMRDDQAAFSAAANALANRAQKLVSTAIMSCTRSSFISV